MNNVGHLTSIARNLIRPYYHRVSYFWMKSLIAKNIELKDLYVGQRCVVVLTGASLKDLDFSLLVDEKVLVCNLFCNHSDFSLLSPVAYFELDPFFSIFRSSDPYVKSGEFYRDLEKSSANKPWPLILSAENAKLFKKKGFFSASKKYYIKSYQTMVLANRLSNDMGGKFTFMDGVAYAMIASAIYMGFKEIYLVGADYTFKPRQVGHFYETWTKLSDVPVDERHHILHKFAKERGVKIFNVVPDPFESPVYPLIRPKDLEPNLKKI